MSFLRKLWPFEVLCQGKYRRAANTIRFSKKVQNWAKSPYLVKYLFCFMILSALWSSNHDYNFDDEFLKLLVLIDLFIMNIEM